MTREDGIELPCGRGGLNEPQPLALAVGDLLLTVHDACAKHELLPLYEKLQANAQRSGERIASAYLSRLPADEQGTETATRNATTLGLPVCRATERFGDDRKSRDKRESCKQDG